jgi:hypothetical protein
MKLETDDVVMRAQDEVQHRQCIHILVPYWCRGAEEAEDVEKLCMVALDKA